MSLYICITKTHSGNMRKKSYLIYRVNLLYSHPVALLLPFIWITIFYFPTIFVCLFWIAILPLCIDLLALGCFVCWFVCLPGKEGLSPRGFVSSPQGCHYKGWNSCRDKCSWGLVPTGSIAQPFEPPVTADLNLLTHTL